MNLNTIKHLASHPLRIVPMLGARGMLNWMPDKMYVGLLFREALGYKMDLKEPKTFNEKLNWLKLHERNPLYTRLADKYAVREYIAETIGEEYLIPLVGGPWNRAEDIDFDALPDEFVLKTTHDSGGVVICRDKKSFDREEAKAKLSKRMAKNYYWGNREWPYKDIKPRIIAEKYMEDESSINLPVYKLMCFNGRPAIFQTIQNDKTPYESIDYFDTDWKLLDMRQNFPNSERPVDRPETLGQMLYLGEKLSAGQPFCGQTFILSTEKCISPRLPFTPMRALQNSNRRNGTGYLAAG